MKNLTVTVDYYNIDITQTISSIGEAVILSGCYNNDPAATAKYCNLITRNPNGRIQSILNTNQNVGEDKTDGIDLAARYAIPTRDFGRFNVIFDGTWLHKYDRVLADGSILHGKGSFDLNGGGTGGVYPAAKFNAGVLWGLGNVGAGVTTKYIGSFRECGTSGGAFDGSGLCSGSGGSTKFTRTVESYNTYDAFVSYNLASGLGRTNIGVGVQNAFDRKPAVIYNGFTAASDPTAYDFLGRFVYLRLTHSL